MKTKQLSIALLSLIVLCTSCNSINKSTETAEKFYEALKKEDFNEALSYCSKEAFANNSKEEWDNLLKNKANYAGELKSYSKKGFNVKTNNGVTTATLNYTVEYEKVTYKEQVRFLESDGEYQIFGYEYHKE